MIWINRGRSWARRSPGRDLHEVFTPGEESCRRLNVLYAVVRRNRDGMSFGRDMKRRMRGAIAPVVFLAVTGYFCWNAVQGPHGLKSAASEQAVLKQAQTELAAAEAERDAWQRRVHALESDHLDRDMLDERARALLNLANPSDIIVQYAPKDRLF